MNNPQYGRPLYPSYLSYSHGNPSNAVLPFQNPFNQLHLQPSFVHPSIINRNCFQNQVVLNSHTKITSPLELERFQYNYKQCFSQGNDPMIQIKKVNLLDDLTQSFEDSKGPKTFKKCDLQTKDVSDKTEVQSIKMKYTVELKIKGFKTLPENSQEIFQKFVSIIEQLLGISGLNKAKLFKILCRSRMKIDHAVRKMKKKLSFYKKSLIL
jgi:hypothetical protein